MLKGIDCVLIWTDNLEKMVDFYTNTLGMEQLKKLDHPQDTGVIFKFSGNDVVFWIGLHSEVHGKNLDKARHMVNFLVDSVDETYNKLKEKGVKFVVNPFAGPTGNGYFATFEDPDGNYLQLWSRKK